MFLIHCPYCDEHREEEEFHASGEAHLPRRLIRITVLIKSGESISTFARTRAVYTASCGCTPLVVASISILRETQ